LECGGLTPLWLNLAFLMISSICSVWIRESGVKPPHSK